MGRGRLLISLPFGEPKPHAPDRAPRAAAGCPGRAQPRAEEPARDR